MEKPKLDFGNFRLREQTVIVQAAQVMDTILANFHAQRHLREGFNLRFLMMQNARLEIQRLIQDRGNDPLSIRDSVYLNMRLNSYYSNLCGALDNLAWMISWELDLLKGLDESDPASRTFSNLFGRDFLKSLDEHYPELATLLEEQRDWYLEVRSLRDPGAHRIPLRFVNSILKPEEADASNEAYQRREEYLRLSSQAIEKGDFKAASEYIDEAATEMERLEGLGKFVPIIATSEASGSRVMSAPDQLRTDHEILLTISNVVLSAFTSNKHGE